MLFELNSKIIEENIDALLCTYPNDSSSAAFDKGFIPETFTVEDKRTGKKTPFFSDLLFTDWVKNLVISQLQYVNLHDNSEIINTAMSNILILLDWCKSVKKVDIYNQEFVEIVRVVVSYTVYGSFEKLIQTATEMNSIADILIPKAIEALNRGTLSIEDWFTVSILSGMSGLDFKNGPLSALNLFKGKRGIDLYPLLQLPLSDAVDSYTESLLSLLNSCTKPIFDWDVFERFVRENQTLIWMTDDYIESCFDFFVIERLLEENNHLKVTIVPKDRVYGNDLSYSQACGLLNDKLKKYVLQQRLSILSSGPRMAAANIFKLSRVNTEMLLKADGIVIKGCRMHEMLQGSLKIPSFSSFNIVAATSEKLSGFKSVDVPVVFMHLSPGEYGFWGVMPENSIDDSDTICCSMRQHYLHKTSLDSLFLEQEYNKMLRLYSNYKGYARPLLQEMRLIRERIDNL